MNPVEIKNTIEAIIQGLEPLEQKLSVPLGFLWRIMLRQVYVDLIQDILFFIIILVGVYFWFRLSKYHQKNQCNLSETMDNFLYGFIIIFGIFIGACLLVSIISLIIDIPQVLFNPEFMALEKILNLLKTK